MTDFLKRLQMFAAGNVVNYSGDGTDSNAGAYNVNSGSTVTTGDLSAEMKTFYEKALIELATPNLVHDQFAKKKPIPRNGGRNIEFRKFSKLPKATQPITEGVTPDGKHMHVDTITASINQYGDYIEQTDLLEITAIDNTIVEATKELASQAGLTLDTIVRDALNTGTTARFAPKDNGNGTYTAISARSALTKDCPLRVKDVFLAAADLKSVDAPKIGDSYVAIIHPKVSYQLMQEAGSAWVDIHKYKNPENIYRGEIGSIGGVRFVESSEAKIYAPKIISDGKNRLTVKTSLDSSGTSLTVKEVLTAGTYSGANKITCYINGTKNYITAIANNTTYSTLTLENSVSTTDGAAGNMVCGDGAGKDGSAVFSTIFIGEGAYATTELTGGGLEHIVKQRGYGNDPLNQRSSIGWKATKTTAILIPEYILRYESTSPDLSLVTDEN